MWPTLNDSKSDMSIETNEASLQARVAPSLVMKMKTRNILLASEASLQESEAPSLVMKTGGRGC